MNIANAQNELNIAIQRLEDYRAKKAEALKEAEKQKEKMNFLPLRISATVPASRETVPQTMKQTLTRIVQRSRL